MDHVIVYMWPAVAGRRPCMAAEYPVQYRVASFSFAVAFVEELVYKRLTSLESVFVDATVTALSTQHDHDASPGTW